MGIVGIVGIVAIVTIVTIAQGGPAVRATSVRGASTYTTASADPPR